MILNRWWVLVLPIVLSLSAVFYTFFLVLPNDAWLWTWNSSLFSASNDDSVHKIVSDQNDVGFHLHPGSHINRYAQTRRLEWNVSRSEWRPDGVAKLTYLINGQFPGPTVEARSGDKILITVRNLLDGDEGVSMHWHGLHVSNDMDGVAGTTQCPIRKGQSLEYNLQIEEDQSGTFWYHSHFDTQRADGLYGAFVIHRPTSSEVPTRYTQVYDNDQVLMIGDWYHRPATEVLDYYMDWKNFKIEPAPDSLLINGKGFFNCSMAVPARPLDCKTVSRPQISLLGGRTRLRIINTGASTGFSISTSEHEMSLFEVDGGNHVELNPLHATKSVGVLYPGERMDLIVERTVAFSDTGGHITVALDRENMKFPNLALTRTQQFQVSGSRGENLKMQRRRSMSRDETEHADVDLVKIRGAEVSQDTFPATADKTFVLYSTISYLAINSNRPKGFINKTSWETSESSSAPLLALDHENWPENPRPFAIALQKSDWVDIVLNNLDDKGHPFHLHGHDFYVLGKHRASRVGAYESYNPFDRSKEPAGGPMNMQSPIKKDTVFVPSMGYVVLRFKASYPGLWFFHCHVLWHQSVGMGMAFQVNSEDPEAMHDLSEQAIRSCNPARSATVKLNR